jgi:hypothetical protein
MIMISLGTYDGAAAQYAVRANTPNPANVSIESGPIAYELVRYEYWAGTTYWDRVSLVKNLRAVPDDSPVHGVVLFELLTDRTLKVETFAGKTTAQVDGFTAAALIYKR